MKNLLLSSSRLPPHLQPPACWMMMVLAHVEAIKKARSSSLECMFCWGAHGVFSGVCMVSSECVI